jgi:aminotransferase
VRRWASKKAERFEESVIREMTRISTLEGGINLAQGFPDFEAPLPMKEAAKRAIDADINQYAITWGSELLREAVAKRTSEYNRIPASAGSNVTVCCGATEAMIATMLAVLDPGDEVILFEPFYENYGPDCWISGAVPKFCRLAAPDWAIDFDELERAFGEKTRAIVINTPHNPTGKVFSRSELERIARLCIEHDVLAITDEIYEYILYDGAEHVSIGSLAGMADRTVTISGLSKTWSATGWRIGWCIAAEEISRAIRKMHDFLTVGAPAPLQEAAAAALGFGENYFASLQREYTERRDVLLEVLEETGFGVSRPQGAYYIMCDLGDLARPAETDTEFAMRLLRDGGVATVPGSSFYADPTTGNREIRFCFAKKLETLRKAAAVLRERLA